MTFACAVGAHFDRLVVIGRAAEGEITHELAGRAVLAELPHYPSLRRPLRLLAALPGSVGASWRVVREPDLVWVSGPHPVGLILVAVARLRGRRAALLIRQDAPRYFRARLPSRRWTPVLAPLGLLDWIFRALARRLPTTVVGPELARRYGAPRDNLLELSVSLIGREQLVGSAPRAEWGEPVRLLAVGRLEPEKSPLTLFEAVALLNRRHPGRYQLTWAGDGRLAAAVRERAEALGIGSAARLAGFVPFGERLVELYRGSDALVHTALTEGLPQVLVEAMASGIPVIATDVGGVGAALEHGRAGVLVPPSDPVRIADAVEALAADRELRERLAERGLELARRSTIEAESARVASFLAAGA
jgi:glycosyltransferase involved in cell wall biosynthesis